MSVTVQPPAAIQIVLFAAGADGKALTTTDQAGKGSFDSSALANLGNLTITEETCAKGRRVLLVAVGAKTPQNRDCRTTQIGTFVAKEVVLNARLSGSFTPALEAVPIPDPAQAKSSTPPAQRAESVASTQKPTAAVASATASSCPPGASMVGAKLDLPVDAETFETAPLLLPCVYRGMTDTDWEKWKYYKVEVKSGQTLKVTARLRDTELPSLPCCGRNWLYMRVHNADGGQVGDVKSTGKASGTAEVEYVVKEPGIAFVSLNFLLRDSVFRISIQ